MDESRNVRYEPTYLDLEAYVDTKPVRTPIDITPHESMTGVYVFNFSPRASGLFPLIVKIDGKETE